jgi:hypothetical protein
MARARAVVVVAALGRAMARVVARSVARAVERAVSRTVAGEHDGGSGDCSCGG